MMIDQAPAIVLLAPFLTAVLVLLVGMKYERACFPLVVLGLGCSVASALQTLLRVIETGTLRYSMGGWPPPFGIEFRIDGLNALVALAVSTAALISAVYSKDRVPEENGDKISIYYTLLLLAVTGLLGMVVTGDAFNLFVLLEVSALTSYALIAMGTRRATLAAYKYAIVGTIGASFYMLGVGYLYIKTGSLNMFDIHEVLVAENLHQSTTVLVAFILITVGVWIKMAFFPLHAWLPNSYAFAPTTTSCLLGPLVTKVMVYVMIRMMLTVFDPVYTYLQLNWGDIVVWMAVIAILAGSLAALAQKDLRRMLAFIIVAEVGYMVGGAWLANTAGLVGAIYHLIADVFMTLSVFLFAGIVFAKTGKREITATHGLFTKMPLTMAGLVVGALSLIGIPPTAGFFSKWYLIQGGITSGHWGYVIALLISSLVMAILFFRVFEYALFGVKPVEGHGDHHGSDQGKFSEASASMLLPLLGTASLVLLIGVFNQSIVSIISDFVGQFNLAGPIR